MARQERPLDPDAGPLAAFAHDLRELRRTAGTPTYRELARKAGYGPSTLSEAAKGVQRPTLDVVLAYVGACGGDVDEWTRRWHTLEPPESPAPEPNPPEPRPAPVQRWRRPVGVAAAAALLAVAATAAFALRSGDAPAAPPAHSAGCPATAAGATFTALTYGDGVNVRVGAARAAGLRYRIPAGCTVGLTGYCIGEKIIDMTAGTPDVRWFTVAGGGVIASALVHGNPPAGLAPAACPESTPAPRTVTLTFTAGAHAARATGQHTEITGFAARYADDPARWQPLGLTSAGADVKTGDARRGDRVVVAVACLGGAAPTDVLDARMVRAGGAVERTAVLTSTDRTDAARHACVYPRPGG